MFSDGARTVCDCDQGCQYAVFDQEKKPVLGIIAAIAIASVLLFGFERVARDPASTSFRFVPLQ